MNEGLAVVIGASGGIGAAVERSLARSGRFAEVIGLSRSSRPRLDLLDEESIRHAAESIRAKQLDLRLVFDATGFLHGEGAMPEKSLDAIDPGQIAHAFAVNATGPALLMKHFSSKSRRTFWESSSAKAVSSDST